MTDTAKIGLKIAIVAFIGFYVVVAAFGFELYFGRAIAPLLIMGSLILRIGVTFAIGAYLWALFGWAWPNWAAICFALPALILVFQHLVADALCFLGIGGTVPKRRQAA